jgi:hypothetical protein
MLILDINETIENQFRKTIGQHWGNKRGYLTKALEQAMQVWVESFLKGFGYGYNSAVNEDILQEELNKVGIQEIKIDNKR